MKSRIVLVVLLLCTQLVYSQTSRYWVTGGDGNWNSTNNWSASSGGASGASIPNNNTFLAIFDANSGSPSVLINLASFNLQKFWITDSQSVTLTSSGAARTITIGDNANNSITGASVTNADFVVESGSTLIIIGESGPRTMTITQNNNANSQTIIIGTIRVGANGILTKAANPTFTFNSGSVYDHNRDAGNIVIATWNAASTCNITGTIANPPGGLNQTFGDLNFNCSVLTSPEIATPAGALLVQGNFSIVGTSGANTMTLQVAGNNFTVNGTTTINSNGIITDNNAGGTNLFVGLVTVNLNGQWNIPRPCTFRGGLTVNSTTFIATSTYTFNTNDQTISGTQSFSITNVTCGTAGRTLTNANINGFTIAGTLSGAGNFTNGTPVFQAVLYLSLSGAGDPMSTFTGIKDFTSNNNTVSYSGAGAQTIGAYNFYNLTAGGGGTRTLINGGTIGISGLFTPIGVYVTTGNTINFNGTGTQNIPAFTFNNITISGGSTKTLIGNVTIGAAGIVNLTSGVLDLANFNLTVNNNTVNAIQGAFSSTNMIATSGTGYLERNAGATLPQSYPIGAGGYYSPATISALATTSPTIRVRAIPTALNPSYINKYWAVTIPSGVITNATATFQYDPAELNGALPSISFSPDGGVSWQNPPLTGTPTFGANSFTITGTSTIAGWWTMGYKTYYSYQTGNWNISSTWTSDPSGTLQIGSTLPNNNDKVVILTGRTVTLLGDVSTSNLDVTINDGGYLNLDTRSFSNPLSALRGQGTLKLASANFPTVTTNTFINAGGGTVEYNVATTLPAAQIVYNNLTINTAGTVIQVNNITLNGNLYIQNGTYQINDGTSARRRLIINGNVTVDNGAAISVGTGVTNSTTNPIGIVGGASPFMNYYDQQSHRVVINGDFTNNGTVRFTNLTYPLFNAFPPTVLGATSGFATVYFFGSTNNALTCNGQTDFYNLVIDKGTDQTYELTINSSSYANFRLFGANVSPGENNVINPDLKKALWIRTGTLVLTGFVVIPSLSEGTTVTAPSSDFTIPANACLTLDGQNVVVLVTADDYRDINVSYGVAGGSGLVNGVGQGGYSGLKVLGKLIVNDGYLSSRESSGLVYSNLTSGQIFINGGAVDAKQFDGVAGGLISYTQTGGLFTLRGRLQRTPSSYTSVSDLVNAPLNTARANEGSIDAAVASFSINSASNVFAMSAGTIRIYDATAVAGRVFDVLSSASNYNVTGGTLELASVTGTVTADAPAWFISSNAPVGNLLLNRSSGSSTSRLNAGYPLTVLKNLTVQVGDLEANGQDVTIGGDFTLQSGTTYSTGANTTTFNGSGTQTFNINVGSALSLNKFTINKIVGDVLNFAGTQTTVNVNDNCRLVLGTLNDNGNTINVLKDVYNSGIHAGTGKIAFIGTVAQAIDGNGVFSNIELNNNTAVASPISLNDNMTVNGVLTFSRDKLFNIGSYNLKLNATASIVNGGTLRYIQTSGNSGDGGITKVYSSTTAFVFPIGAPTLIPVRTVKYTPATIGFSSAPTTYGSVTIIPVGYEHPSTTVNGQSLTYFWRIKSSGFIGIPANSVTHNFVYDQSDVVGTEGNYIPSVYNRATYTWNNGVAANINTGTNTVSDWAAPTNSRAFLDGDYTAGDACFGTPTKFYSIASSAWNLNTTWSYTSGGAAVPAGAVAGVNFPGPNSVVVIENNRTVNLTATQNCASLQIQTGSTLDIYTWTNSTFGMVLSHPSGNGLFRLTTTVTPVNIPKVFSFPTNSDFTDFNNNSGTTEYYDIDGTSGALYILPSNVTTYGNLMVTARGGDNLVLPNNALTTIKGNLTCGGDNPNAWICASWNTTNYYGSAVYNPTIEKTVHVTGNMNINTGTFIFMREAVPQHIVVDGNVTVGAGAWITLEPTGTNCPNSGPVANTFAIGGNLINNATSAPYISFLNGTFYCNVTFQGSTNAFITGTGASTVFNRVTVNKGISQATTLTLNIGGALSTPVDNWLTLQNGTLQYMRTNPNSDFTISQGTAFTIPSTAGLYINYSNTGNRNILIGNAASNTNDLFLNGKLTLIQGKVYVGPTNGTTNNNNDIEYSGGGASFIEIQGGTLVVNGQIRRNPSTSAGILSYVQSGGTVIVNGNNAIASNAKLEVLNLGSVFNMSGATSTLTIVRGGGASFGDLYLRPGSSSVTGGEIIFTQAPSVGPVVDVVQNYSLDANFTLNNLTITGKTAATARNATASLMVSPLILDGILKLTNANSIFTSNNRNVTISGDLNNSGTYNFGTNNTTFNGGAQSIIGSSVTNFYDLTVSSVSSLTVNNSFTVNNNLSINSGTLTLSNKKLTLKGNIINNSSYTDDNTIGGVSLAGTSLQQITGTGAFGRLELNNGFGAKLNNDITLQNDLVLTQGILDLNQYLLTLGLNTNIDGAPFGQSKMIITDGVASSSGVRKFFNTTAIPVSFTYPIGVTGKYTPALLNITANGSVGYINIKPINSSHPAVVDPSQVLKYYWGIASSGISGFAGSLQLQYLASDVLGVESNYVAAKLLTPGTYWSKATTGPLTDNVDETNHHIDYTITAGTNDITGDYTAGINAALPDDVPSYISNADGDWTDNTIWDPIGASPPCPVGGPNGFNVVVANTVTANVSYCFAYRTTINGTLKMVYPTFGHNLGTIDGNGKLYLEGGNLPAGDFTSFLDCSIGGVLEYSGSGSYTIIATQYNTVPYLFFTGSGTRTLPNKDLTICNRLVIDGPTLDNNTNKRRLTILGTMERLNTGAFLCGSGVNATVAFAGSALQTIGGALGDFLGANSFNNLEINNSSGLNIGNNGVIQLSGNLLLTNGIINTSSTNRLYLNGPSTVTPSGGSSTSFVNGPLYKYIFSGSSFLYPVGKGTQKGHVFTLTSTAAVSLFWLAEYFTPNPTATSLSGALQAANTMEYWSVSTSGAYTAKVKIGWDPFSDLTPLMTVSGISDMRVAEYNAGNWVEQVSTATGDNNNGDVATTNNVNISTTPINYTTASISSTKPRASLNPSGPVCGNAGIPVKFTSFTPINLDYTLDYTFNGVAQPTVNITSLPYTLPTPSPGTYKLTGFTYNSGANTGVVDPTIITDYAVPTTSNAGLDQSLCGFSGYTLAGNNPNPYSGLWSTVSGSGGVILTPTAFNSVFNGISGNTYTLRWTISSGTCTSADDVIIAFPVAPQKPSSFISAPTPICQGSTGNIYTVALQPGVTYNWTYSGTGATIVGTGNSVTLNYDNNATSGTLDVTATNGCGTSLPRSVSVTVSPLPITDIIYHIPNNFGL